MNTKLLLAILLSFFLVYSSCTEENDPGGEIEVNTKSQEIVDADNAFGLDIFKLIANQEQDSNFMISPLSISMALSMAYNGAETDTKAEMAEALRISDFTRDEINQTYKELIAALITVDPDVAMEIANSIWYSDVYPVEENFLTVNQNYYDAEVQQGDFSNPGMTKKINDWVSDKTHKKIPTIIDGIDPATVMFIINAIYFNGSWTREFNEENSYTGLFEKQSQNYIEAEMMQGIDTVNYLSNETFSAIQLPYGHGNFSMMLLLPNSDKTVADVVEEINTENWSAWLKGFSMTNDVDIILPKFKLEYEKKLKDILQLMGMEQAFTTQADFSGINANRDLFISEVLHKTFIDVNEKGTEAAAVTAIIFDTTSIDPNEEQKTYFHCTRPFLFAITEKDTGAILFMGQVSEPAYEE